MSAVANVGIHLNNASTHSFDYAQPCSRSEHAMVSGDGFMISGTPDQLLDLAALLIDAANLVYEVEAEKDDDGLTYEQARDQRRDEINGSCVVCDDKGCRACVEVA
jgi:hypothetical protein